MVVLNFLGASGKEKPTKLVKSNEDQAKLQYNENHDDLFSWLLTIHFSPVGMCRSMNENKPKNKNSPCHCESRILFKKFFFFVFVYFYLPTTTKKLLL
jgi:hypothetical protein